MKISLNTLRFYQDTYKWAEDPAPNGLDALVEKIGAQLGAVEDVEDYGTKYADVIITRVVSCVDHPNADRLHVCKIDDGGVVEGIERDENGYVQVVCGAPNVREGLLVAWLPPGSTVPETYHHEEPFVLSARELRGVVSNGMLASAKELALSDDHEGILEIDADAQPGMAFVKAYDLDDYIIDIENKMFTHRPDCFGFMGVAREIAGIHGQKFESPDWYVVQPEFPTAEGQRLTLEIENQAQELVPRFTAIAMKNVKVQKSPLWMQTALLRLGSRPINNVVDYTNYIMMLTGQPLHAYDYDKLATGKLGVRMAQNGEKINLLNGKQAELTDKDVVITDGEKPVGLGGVMGGADTEVDENTKNIIIECANFDMYAIRRTSMRHGLFTDAVTRFNKGQSPLQNLAVLAKIVNDIQRDKFGEVAGEHIDNNHVSQEAQYQKSVHPAVQANAAFINARLGLELSVAEIARLLENVEFKVEQHDEMMSFTAPFWRTDIEIPEDIVEEVGRLYGYDRLPLVLPKRDIAPAQRNEMLDLKTRVREILSRAGANEVLTYSFVHNNLLQRAEQDSVKAFQISNALSPDLQFYRLSVLPSLLDKVHGNIKSGYEEFALFELGRGHLVDALDEENLPAAIDTIELVYAASDKVVKPGAAYYQARGFLVELMQKLGLELTFVPWADGPQAQGSRPFDPARTAAVYVKGSDDIVGIIGELKQSVRKNFKLPTHTAAFTIVTKVLLEKLNATATTSRYAPLSRFPATSQDICFRVSVQTDFSSVQSVFEEALGNVDYEWKVEPIDMYQSDDDQDHKQVTLRVTLNNPAATLRSQDVQPIIERIIDAGKRELNAEYV